MSERGLTFPVLLKGNTAAYQMNRLLSTKMYFHCNKFIFVQSLWQKDIMLKDPVMQKIVLDMLEGGQESIYLRLIQSGK
ncbi:hypothetical protein [Bacillus horti]|uniref:Uncharacterized protein n=1 Tax=Caldalkalibacillus horti TaxID=77523 RepID=A0ABT9VZH0_9BACI|nr:hypothetical protein [Bacillus horti]